MSLQAPWSAGREWLVTGTTSITEAAAAVPEAKRDVPYTPGSPLTSKGPKVDQTHVDQWKVTAIYTVPEKTGGQQPEQTENPLDKKTVWSLSPATISFPTDVDLDGKPLMVASGDLNTSQSRTVLALELTGKKNYPFWNQSWFDNYQGAVNTNVVSLCGNTYPVEHVLCNGCWPTGDFTIDAPYIQCQWRFLFIPANTIGAWPHQYRFGNTSLNGWYDNAGVKTKATFTTKNLETGNFDPVNNPVAMYRNGVPLDSAITVAGKPPVSNPLADLIVPYQFTYYPTGSPTPTMCWYYYKNFRLASFAGIPI